MEAVKRIFKFGAGGALGAAIGASVAGFLAPQRGDSFQANTRSFVTEVKTEGERAKAATEAALAEKFRQQVDDDKALTGKVEHREPKKV